MLVVFVNRRPAGDEIALSDFIVMYGLFNTMQLKLNSTVVVFSVSLRQPSNCLKTQSLKIPL